MRMPAIAFCLLFIPAAHAAIVDRAAVKVGNRIITESEIVRRIRLTAFQNGTAADLSPAARREAARRLIDLRLVEREMDLGHYDRTGSIVADALATAFANDHYRGSEQALELALKAAGLAIGDLKDEFTEQADLLSFLTLRFRPAVEVTDSEIEKYYRDHSGDFASLEEGRAKIAELLTNQHSDADLDAWLRDQREHTRIVYLVKELQ